MINSVLNKFIQNEDVSNNEIKEVFDEIFSGLSDTIASSSFISLFSKIKNSNYTPDDLYCATASARDAIKKINTSQDKNNLIETICFGETNGIIDIPFAVDIVCSCVGLGCLKYSFDY